MQLDYIDIKEVSELTNIDQHLLLNAVKQHQSYYGDHDNSYKWIINGDNVKFKKCGIMILIGKFGKIDELDEILNLFYKNGSKRPNKAEFERDLIGALTECEVEIIKSYQIMGHTVDYYLPKYDIAIDYTDIGYKYRKNFILSDILSTYSKTKYISLDYNKKTYLNIGIVYKEMFDKNYIDIVL